LKPEAHVPILIAGMSLSLDFKLRIPPPPKFKTVAPLLPIVVVSEPIAVVNNIVQWTIAARIACIVAVTPLLLMPKGIVAAYVHLLTMPATAFVLQKYNHTRYALGLQSLLALICVLLGNISAVMFLLPYPDARQPLALSLILAAAQLLWVAQKRVMLRVMFCTATAIMVMALAILGAVAPPPLGCQFFQSSAMPLVLLFMETTRASDHQL
jgi:hypothetical protein